MQKIFLFLRSLLFWLCFTISTIIIALLFLPTILTKNQKLVSLIGSYWGKTVMFLLSNICNLTYMVKGEVPNGSVIIAARHESMWETIWFLVFFDRPAFVLKKELCYIPIYGWYLKPMGMIAIDRASGVNAIKHIQSLVQKVIDQGRPIGIFPHGTRIKPNEQRPLKAGIYIIHKAAPLTPIIPVKLNSGLFWPKGSFIIYPGTIQVEFCEDINIQPMSKDQLLEALHDNI